MSVKNVVSCIMETCDLIREVCISVVSRLIQDTYLETFSMIKLLGKVLNKFFFLF